MKKLNAVFMMVLCLMVMTAAFGSSNPTTQAVEYTVIEPDWEDVTDQFMTSAGLDQTGPMNPTIDTVDISDKKDFMTSVRISAKRANEAIPEVTATPKKTAKGIAGYSQKELDMLYRLVEAEVGDSNKLSKKFSTWVVLNRLKRKDFPNTIKGVIFQKNQYSVTLKGHRYWTVKPSKHTKDAVNEALREGNKLPIDVIFADGKPRSKKIYKKVDGTYYCYARYTQNGKRIKGA